MGTAQSCVRGGLEWTLGRIFLPEGVEHGRFPREVTSAPGLTVSERHLDNAHLSFDLISDDLVRQLD